VAAVDELLNLVLANMLDVRLAGIEHGNFAGVGVKTRDFVTGFREAQGEGKSYITAADDSNF
jgi:hypothetical protein